MNWAAEFQQVEQWRSRLASIRQSVELNSSLALQLLPYVLELEAALVALALAGEKQQQQHEHQVLAAAPHPYLVTDMNGTICQANRATATLLNVTPQLLVGQPLMRFVPAAQQQFLRDQISQASQSEGIKEWEICLMPWHRQSLTVAVRAVVVRSQSQPQLVLHWWLCDLTQQQQMTAALERLQSQHELILNSAGEGIYGLDLQGNVTFVNPAAASMVGWNSGELLGQPMHEIVHHSKPDGSFYSQQECPICSSLSDGLIHHVGNEVFWHQDGSSFPVEYTSTPLRAAGAIVGTVVVFKDITERKQAEASQKQHNSQMESLVQQRTAQLQRALDLEAMLKRITDQVRDSQDANQILQTAVQELAIGLGLGSCNASWYNLGDATSSIYCEYVNFLPESERRVKQMAAFPEIYQQLRQREYFQFCSIEPHPIRGRVAMLACPIVGEEGVIGDLWLVTAMEYAFDELELRLVQQVANQCAIALRTARLYQATKAQVQELEKLNQLKDDFLSTVSHELRTPVANMKMAIRLLQTAPSRERQEHYLNILAAECEREVELINNLLDLQQLEAGSYSFLFETLELGQWISKIVAALQLRMQQHQQLLSIELPETLKPILCERTALGRIVVELLNNAHKYTADGGKIHLKVQQQPVVAAGSSKQAVVGNPVLVIPASEMLTTLTISNEAEIPRAELGQIFDKFYRVPQADRWRQSGTGLGLALVQRLVERLHGSIQVESDGGWTTFTVQLPTWSDGE